MELFVRVDKRKEKASKSVRNANRISGSLKNPVEVSKSADGTRLTAELLSSSFL